MRVLVFFGAALLCMAMLAEAAAPLNPPASEGGVKYRYNDEEDPVSMGVPG
jgi:hypothetical protein